jgi:hypothetical protein
MDCTNSPLLPPKVVARATDAYLTPTYPFPDSTNLPMVPPPTYGQELTFGYGRTPQHPHSVGKTPDELKPKMYKLLDKFASGDKSGMARRLFDASWPTGRA